MRSHVSRLVTMLLSLAIVLAVTAASAKAGNAATSGTKSTEHGKAVSQSNAKTIVYYLHGDYRCTNCINFEKYTNEVMTTTFGDALKNGQVDWKIVNTDRKENAHFMKDFKLFTKSVVVVNMKNGKPDTYKNLQAIWQLVGNKAKFQEYIAKEVNDSLSAQ